MSLIHKSLETVVNIGVTASIAVGATQAATDEQIVTRTAQCDACDQLLDGRRCGGIPCKCFVDQLARLADRKCPLGKW